MIATGSDNTSRYFEYYFGKYPNIIRRNRNSVAIIDGNDKESDLAAMGEDIFSYLSIHIFFIKLIEIQIFLTQKRIIKTKYLYL